MKNGKRMVEEGNERERERERVSESKRRRDFGRAREEKWTRLR